LRAAIVGIEGPALLASEREMLQASAPAGVILFARNIEGPDQLRRLTAELRAVLPGGAVLMVDQEGGRVARLLPPHWRAHPAAGRIGALHAEDPPAGLRAAWLTGTLIGLDCARAGFDVACAPVLDLLHPGAHDIVGDRSFGADPEAVALLGRAVAHGLMAAGVQPVGKHAPGHGRAKADSHLELPRIEAHDLDTDLEPFALNADLPWFMTAHILYTAWDAARPATLSPAIVGGVIRDRIGFTGVLVTDDLAMQALSGPPATLALEALSAGCDLALYCAGDFGQTEALLAACPALTDAASARLASARETAAGRRIALDAGSLAAERDRLPF
jgi:beta-N-acetylhexosaminidase